MASGCAGSRKGPADAAAIRRYGLMPPHPMIQAPVEELLMGTEDPHDPGPEPPREQEHAGEEPNPTQKRLKDNEKSELGGAKN
jgi:hypothetical protein